MAQQTPIAFETVREIALALPGVEEGTSYGTAGVSRAWQVYGAAA
jgi:hypothetical protein